MSQLDYVSTTLNKVVMILAANGSIRARMKFAAREWHPITADKLPKALRNDWQYIVDRLSSVKNDDIGNVPATINKLSDDALNDLAIGIMQFAFRVEDFEMERQ